MNTYYAKSLMIRQRRKQQVRRNIMLLIASVFLAAAVAVMLVSFSTEANDMEHQPSYKYYKSIEISKGDTLWSIANNYIDHEHYKNTFEYVKEVKQMNSLTSDKIVAGNHIIVPYYSSEFIYSDEQKTSAALY